MITHFLLLFKRLQPVLAENSHLCVSLKKDLKQIWILSLAHFNPALYENVQLMKNETLQMPYAFAVFVILWELVCVLFTGKAALNPRCRTEKQQHGEKLQTSRQHVEHQNIF